MLDFYEAYKCKIRGKTLFNYIRAKYFLDVVIITIFLPLITPIFLLSAIVIKIFDQGGSIFFQQERVGIKGKKFIMYKFRTMKENQGKKTGESTEINDERITKVGYFLRKSRIDELPQIINVVLGQMSLIGPRAEYAKFAIDFQRMIPMYEYRHIVKPGISGWAQVSQEYPTGLEETKVKLEYDFYYIKNICISLDILILLKTIKTVVSRKGSR